MGGEKEDNVTKYEAFWGSPPRGRGKVDFRIVRVQGIGINPAWAGKSADLPAGQVVFGDHPRVGGEKFSVSS